MRLYIRFLLLIAICSLTGALAQAQPNRDTFGKSRIQYKEFDWKLYSTQNFNVYFYKGGQETAQNAAEYAEKELRRITSLIGYYPYSKVTLVLYNSPTDLLQSNIGLNNDQYQTGGETLFMKNKIEMAYQGTQTEFKRDLSYQLTQLLMNDMMYGGSLKEALQSSYLLRLPQWFISGVAAYTAEGWSVRMDNFVRDMLLEQQNKQRPERLFAVNPELTGQSVWNYIAERYGYTAIQNILNLTRITRDVEIGITSSLNIPYKRFLQDWYNYYLQINTSSDSPLVVLPDNAKLFKKNKEGHFYGQPALNPSGTLLAYAKNDNGIYKIFVHDIRRNKDYVVWRAGYKSIDQTVDYKMPVLAWRSNTQLGIVEARRGEVVLRQVDATSRYSFVPFVENLTTPLSTLPDFTLVQSMDYAEDGNSLVVSAVRNGQTDLYLLRASGRLQQQLTNDIYDDIDPVFLQNNGGIAFSSNRLPDTTGAAATATFSSVVNNFDIFLLQQQGPNTGIRQLTTAIASEVQPQATPDGNLVYLSEQSGVRSLYRYDLSTGSSTPVTNFVQGIEAYDYVPTANVLAVVATDESRRFVYLLPQFTASTLAELPRTSRQIILETRARTSSQAATSRKIVEDKTAAKPKTQRKQGEVDIQDYSFDSDSASTNTTAKAASKPGVRRATSARSIQMTGPLDYDLRFSVQEIVTSVHADPLLGFGIVAGVNMSDLFENHHIQGTAFVRTDLGASNYWAQYMNLKNRLDMGIEFERETLEGGLLNVPGSRVRFAKNELSPKVVFPLSHSTSIHAMPKFVSTRFTYMNDFFIPDSVENFWGGNVELVYDNSVKTGINMMEGTRLKVGLLSLKGFNGSASNFNKVYVDFRNYLKIHRQIVLATRINYGAFFGNARKKFLIGGMDNWLLADQDESAELNDVEISAPADLFYLEYVTPLRGFNYNVRSGSRHLLANAELRIPIVQYMYNGPISSGFFRNLQLTAFADAGSAYDGANPFTGNNSINTRVIGGVLDPVRGDQDPFDITVINYRNPFLIGYGVGARTTLLGVYGKLDVAWGEAEESRTGPKFYITLGYDF
ncbi:TolB family protein [Pontibacter sp. CAU 1760]